MHSGSITLQVALNKERFRELNAFITVSYDAALAIS